MPPPAADTGATATAAARDDDAVADGCAALAPVGTATPGSAVGVAAIPTVAAAVEAAAGAGQGDGTAHQRRHTREPLKPPSTHRRLCRRKAR
jgi:hypothetical protein